MVVAWQCHPALKEKGAAGMNGSSFRYDWIVALRRYLVTSAIAHLLWEIVQLPFYTLWSSGTSRTIAFAVVHCTGGDILIAGSSLLTALALVGRRGWPVEVFWRVAGVTLMIGIGYTIYSEWLNTAVRLSWAYSKLMPVVPWIGTGLSPLAQWVVVPALALWAARAGTAGSGAVADVAGSRERAT